MYGESFVYLIGSYHFPVFLPVSVMEFRMNLLFPDQSFPHLQNRTSAVKQEASVCPAAIGGPFKILNRSERPETISEKRFCGLCYVIGSHVALAFIQMNFRRYPSHLTKSASQVGLSALDTVVLINHVSYI